MLLPALLLAVLGLGAFAHANVEKVIFTAPAPAKSPDLFSSLTLEVLSHNRSSLRKHLPVEFPTATAPKGLQSWYLLDQLEPGRKYEVRICWPATQPTAFSIREYPLSQIADDVSLAAFMSQSSDKFRAQGDLSPDAIKNLAIANSPGSRMLLQVFAAADYYTSNKTLMKYPAPVHVDIILDPYILYVLPKSLLPTAIYILLIAIGSWYLSEYIWTWLHNLSQKLRAADEAHYGEKSHAD